MFPGMLPGLMANNETSRFVVPATEPPISGLTTIVRLTIAAGALAVMGSVMALHWREQDTAPKPATRAEDPSGGVRSPGAAPADYVLLSLEKTARQNYCVSNGGTVIGEQALKCDFGPCTGAENETCGIREVVCDDIPDAHQCGLMGRAAKAGNP